MRNAFIDELAALAGDNKNIALVVGDLGYSVVEPFSERFPNRFINAGVAEQNMTSLAAGMASEGYHVFTYSIANFPTFRCAEQIRNDIDYHNLPVTVVTVGGGVAYGALGYSHHAVQDYALMRCMPNMMIASPGDPMEVRACLRYLVANPQPSYLRLGKAGEPSFHKYVPRLTPGKWELVSSNKTDERKALLTTGAGLEIAMNLLKSTEFYDHQVLTLPLWGISVKKLQPSQIRKWHTIVTVEDHLLDGGFGSWILEAASMDSDNECSLRSRIINKALSVAVCGTVGSQSTLYSIGGLKRI